ncbi:MAG: Mu-like prophage major head subunit gpT family protein [bacterium]
MPMNNFVNTLIPGIYAKSIAAYTEAPKLRRRVANIVTGQKSPFYMEKSTDLPIIPSKTKGAAMQEILADEGFTKQITATTYAAYLRFYEEDIEDDRYGLLMDYTKRMGVSANETQELNFWNTCFNDGFGTTKTADTAYVFSASHKHKAGGASFSNLASAAALSVTTLWTAINQGRAWKDSANKHILMTPKALIVPVALEQVAKETLRSTHWPLDDSNKVNVIQDFNLDLMISKYLSSDAAWFVLFDKHEIYHWPYKPVTFANDGDFLSRDSMYSVRFRDANFVYSGMGVIGNAGA